MTSAFGHTIRMPRLDDGHVTAAADPAFHESLLAVAVDLVFVLGADGRVRYASPSVIELIGVPQAELVGSEIAALIHPCDLAGFRACLDEVASAGGTFRVSHRVRQRDGAWRGFESVGRDLRHEPIGGILIQARDMTPWSQLEAVLAESCEAAHDLADVRSELIERLQQLDTSKARLSELLVHDLKSPLTVVMHNAKFIVEDITDTTAVVSYAATIERSGQLMYRMILDLLDVGLSEDGRLIANLQELDMAAVVGTAVAQAAALVKAKQQRLVCETVTSRPLVRGDADLLGRVAQNLVDNCSKYAPRCSDITIWIADADDDRIELGISDHGPGIPDEYKDKIFELYARVESGDTHARTSRGVGLAFCRLALAAHGGHISVEDNPGGGSLFRCRWPR